MRFREVVGQQLPRGRSEPAAGSRMNSARKADAAHVKAASTLKCAAEYASSVSPVFCAPTDQTKAGRKGGHAGCLCNMARCLSRVTSQLSGGRSGGCSRRRVKIKFSWLYISFLVGVAGSVSTLLAMGDAAHKVLSGIPLFNRFPP